MALGTGVADIQKVLLEIAKQEPPPTEDTTKRTAAWQSPRRHQEPLFIVLDVDRYPGMDPAQVPWPGLAFGDLARDAEGFEVAARPAMGYRVQQAALIIPTHTNRWHTR